MCLKSKNPYSLLLSNKYEDLYFYSKLFGKKGGIIICIKSHFIYKGECFNSDDIIYIYTNVEVNKLKYHISYSFLEMDNLRGFKKGENIAEI